MENHDHLGIIKRCKEGIQKLSQYLLICKETELYFSVKDSTL